MEAGVRGSGKAESMLTEALGSEQHGQCHTARAFQMQRESLKDS